jgi:protoporphyrin/coproporphyrin ferrochelatase
MSDIKPNQAVLFLATGSATSPENVAEFVTDIREGRTPSPQLVEEVKHRYELIGGSPFMRITLAQSAALRQELVKRGIDVPVFNGMCHCEPRIREAVGQMKAAGIQRAVALILAPLPSTFNTNRYARRLDDAQQKLGANIEVRWVEPWWSEPKFIQAWARNVRQALDSGGGLAKLVFTAHSLPARIRQAGDGYEEQLKSCAERIAKLVGYPEWTIAFQSAGQSPEPWLGPSLKELIPTLPAEEYARLVVAPVGFVCDNAEILYDIDIEAKELAREHGLGFYRAAVMNDDPWFIEAVANAVERRLG